VDLFDKFAPLIRDRDALFSSGGPIPTAICMDELVSQTVAIIDGRETILAGTNNYLGLTFDPRSLAAAEAALKAGGTGTTGSRNCNGTYSGHKILEAKLAEFYGTKGAMVFSTGYQANLSMLSTLAGPKDYILIDADCHASIYDGCKLGNATVIRFRHNDPADLEKRLKRLGDDVNKLIVVEGIYSMLGDIAPLDEFVAIRKRLPNTYILVDEAHSLGVMGETGRGAAQHFGVGDEVDFIVGTFSKSVGTIGGFCVSNHPKFDILRLAARPYMFTASLPPSVVASATVALDIIRTTPNLRKKLWANANRLHRGLSSAGFELGAPASPVVAIKVPSLEIAFAFWRSLIESGIYVNLMVPPATPQNWYLLRCSLCAAHTPSQIDTIIGVFIKIGAELGLLPEAANLNGHAVAINGTLPSVGGAKRASARRAGGAAAATG
jgi:8-amino-7-oxononanoate synthase